MLVIFPNSTCLFSPSILKFPINGISIWEHLFHSIPFILSLVVITSIDYFFPCRSSISPCFWPCLWTSFLTCCWPITPFCDYTSVNSQAYTKAGTLIHTRIKTGFFNSRLGSCFILLSTGLISRVFSVLLLSFVWQSSYTLFRIKPPPLKLASLPVLSDSPRTTLKTRTSSSQVGVSLTNKLRRQRYYYFQDPIPGLILISLYARFNSYLRVHPSPVTLVSGIPTFELNSVIPTFQP